MLKKSKNPLEQFSQVWLFEDLFEHPEFAYKRMFGGLAIYFSGLMVAVLMEDPEQKHYKNLKFDYPIWNGLLIPTNREHHQSLQNELPQLVPHPVLGKWLYLPMTDADYDEVSQLIFQFIRSKDLRLGIVPGLKKSKKSQRKKFKKTEPLRATKKTKAIKPKKQN